VGDFVGTVGLGYPDTTHVTMAEMLHHMRAAVRAKPRTQLTADLICTFPWFTPRFVKPRANCAGQSKIAVAEWMQSLGGK
jgi:3-methyl-2-oxobutanoate hydroxymethyltransferase